MCSKELESMARIHGEYGENILIPCRDETTTVHHSDPTPIFINISRVYMDTMFGKVKTQLLMFTVSCISLEKSYALGLLAETELFMISHEKSTDYITGLLTDLYKMIGNKFEMFINEQSSIIEEIKNAPRKKGGVLSVFQTFPVN